ncbi:MAG: imidazole glycerol phosphate synthase subunit HisH [Clostridiaceae bacterium]|nr:imidazole glycerol phosphate synthase subunit HisH [Clostridiaceae bacterium]
MTGIVDYGVGNLFSLQHSLLAIGQPSRVTSDPDELRKADRVILPGVGAFGDAMQKLCASGLDAVVRELAAVGRPLLGVCLGMQLLFDKSYEYGDHAGLGLIHGEVMPMEGTIAPELKIPQMGWNALRFAPGQETCPLLSGIRDGDYVYFVHSYYAAECGPAVAAYTDYGVPMPAVVWQDNVMGCQFHPEKSGQTGLAILKAFCGEGALA